MSTTYTPTFSANSVYNTVTVNNELSSGVITLNGITTSTYSNPITATGEFLGIKINGTQKFIKIWNN
jgi:hypothetical protein